MNGTAITQGPETRNVLEDVAPMLGQLAPIEPGDLEENDDLSLPAFLEADPGMAVALEQYARKLHLLEMLEAQAAMDRLNRRMRHMEVTASEGMGEVHRLMPAAAWHDIALKEGTYDCYKDRSFNRYIDRVAPETKVRCYSPRSGNGRPLQVPVGWDRRRSAPRFRKSYAEETGVRSQESGGTVQDANPDSRLLTPDSSATT